jgi:hypothetical protein
MRRLLPLILLALVVSVAAALAQPAAEKNVIGKWSGTYTGDGNGKYTMTMERDATKKLGGTLASTNAEGESSSSTFKTVTVDGAKLSITYDTPGGEGGEFRLDAVIDRHR